MIWIGVGVNQGDGTTADTLCQVLLQAGFKSWLQVQWLGFKAICTDASRYFDNGRGQVRRRRDLQSKEIRSVLITDAMDVSKAHIGEQQHRCSLGFKQSIGGHGGSQPNLLDQPIGENLIPVKLEDLPDGMNSRILLEIWLIGKHLAHNPFPLGPDPNQIGKGSATINPELPGHS